MRQDAKSLKKCCSIDQSEEVTKKKKKKKRKKERKMYELLSRQRLKAHRRNLHFDHIVKDMIERYSRN